MRSLPYAVLARVALACVVVLAAWDWLAPDRGLIREAFDEPGLRGHIVDRRTVRTIGEAAHRGPGLPTRYFSLRFSGYWDVPASGRYDLSLGADDAAAVEIEQNGNVRRIQSRGFATDTTSIDLSEGPARVQVVFEQLAGWAFLDLAVARHGGLRRPLDSTRLYVSSPSAFVRRQARAFDLAWRAVALLWLFWGLAAASAATTSFLRASGVRERGLPALADHLRQSFRRLEEGPWRRPMIGVALLLVTLLAAILRLDAMFAKYGPMPSPSWAVRLHAAVEPAAALVRPPAMRWPHVDAPYVGGDPINYLKYAREMTSFYQAHVREPVFLAATRAWLAALGDQDIAVSFASATFSILLVPATYLLASAAFGSLAGLVGAALMAIEATAINWGVDGMRDDASAVFVALTAWSLVRLLRRPSWWIALAGGLLGAAAVLTRITSLGLWVPGVALAVWWGPREQRGRRAKLALANLLVGGALIAPYLVNCWTAFGDPLYAVNYHTVFYRARENVAFDAPQSAGAYALTKMKASPVRSLDTVLYGLTVFPFSTKWNGFRPWLPGAGAVLAACALGGLGLAAAGPPGRLVLACLLLAVAPFALTWAIPGGAEWRFTLPAYPFYLAACGLAITTAGSFALAIAERRPREWLAERAGQRPRRWALCLGAAVVIFGTLLVLLPWLSIREALGHGGPVAVVPGERNAVVLRDGWDVLPGGCAAALGDEQTLWLPLSGPLMTRVRLQLTTTMPPGAPPEPIELIAPGAAGVKTVVLTSDNRNQEIEIDVPRGRRERFVTRLVLRPVAGPDGQEAGQTRRRSYSLCRVDLWTVDR
jgi:hypothetical protein